MIGEGLWVRVGASDPNCNMSTFAKLVETMWMRSRRRISHHITGVLGAILHDETAQIQFAHCAALLISEFASAPLFTTIRGALMVELGMPEKGERWPTSNKVERLMRTRNGRDCTAHRTRFSESQEPKSL